MSVQTITGWDDRAVEVSYSRGASAVPYLVDWRDNVLQPPVDAEWPASLLRQVRSYVARRSWFADDDADLLAAKLGAIRKFQSLNSENAVTWSWFGTLGLADSQTRRRTLQWLYDEFGLELKASAGVRIGQWLRVMHPNAPDSPYGPELDTRIDDPGGALVYVEAKWEAALGSGKGATEGTREDLVVLRRDSLRSDPALAADGRLFVVLGVSNGKPDLAAYEERTDGHHRRVQIAWTTWSDLARCEVHPLAAEFGRYLAWKRSFATRSPH